MEKLQASLTRSVAQVLVFALVAGAFLVLQPFIVVLIWGGVLAIATWPIYHWLGRRLTGRRTFAAGLATTIVFITFFAPVAFVGDQLRTDGPQLIAQVQSALQEKVPPLPDWASGLPIIGERLVETRATLVHRGERLANFVTTQIETRLDSIAANFERLASSIASGLIDLFLSLFCLFFFYRDGQSGVVLLTSSVQTLFGEPALRFLAIAHATIRAVVYGVIGSALTQGLVSFIGYEIVGAPAALLLFIITAIAAVIPGGIVVVWLPLSLWLLFTGSPGWALFIALWCGVLAANLDSIIKPYFIKRGSNLPMVLVFFGVLGGGLAFGLLGLFVGPTILALLYALIKETSPSRPAEANE